VIETKARPKAAYGSLKQADHSTLAGAGGMWGVHLPTTVRRVAPTFATVPQCLAAMDNFPEFMKHPANRIATSNQGTPGVEGYVFDGADGSQMAF